MPSGPVTFPVTDIHGSTQLLEQLREQYAVVLADQRDLLRAALAAHNGREISALGALCWLPLSAERRCGAEAGACFRCTGECVLLN